MSVVSQRIDVVGPESSGKTTLSQALASVLPAEMVAEHLRSFVALHQRAPRQTEQEDLLATQEDLVRRAMSGGATWVVNDGGALQTAAYHLAYFHQESLIEPAVAATATCRLIVRCTPDFGWIADPGQRDGPRWQGLVDAALDTTLRRAQPPVLTVGGPPQRRINAVLEALGWPTPAV